MSIIWFQNIRNNLRTQMELRLMQNIVPVLVNSFEKFLLIINYRIKIVDPAATSN